MFSILVSELTPQLIAKAEYWRFMQIHPSSSETMAETLPVSRIQLDTSLTGWNRVFRLQMETEEEWVYYDSDVRCLPVTLSPDGTEVRLECPRMPDEPLIEEWQGQNAPPQFAMYQRREKGVMWWILEREGKQVAPSVHGPTNQYCPRRTCEGVWVWSTRK